MPELSAELFAQKGIGAFQFSVALIAWLQSELEGLHKIWVQAYKNAWHIPWSTTNSLYTFSTAEGGHEWTMPSGVLTQALLQHVDQCMRHGDVVKTNYASAIYTHIDRVALQLIYWLDEKNGAVELERSKRRFLVTIGKVVVQSKSVSHMDRKNGPKTRSSARPWKNELGNGNAVHSKVQNTNWEDWGIVCRNWANCLGPWYTSLASVVHGWRDDAQRHTDLHKGRIRKCRRSTKDSYRLYFKSILGSATTAQVVCNVEWWAKSSNACTQCARTPQHHPISDAGVPKSSWLKGLELPSTERKCKASVKKFERSPTLLAEWIEMKETLAKFQAEKGNETSDDQRSDDMTSKAERKRKSDASPVEFCRRGLAGGNVWDSLTDLLKIMKLREVGAGDVKEVWEIVQHLFTNLVKPARSKRDSRQSKTHLNNLLF